VLIESINASDLKTSRRSVLTLSFIVLLLSAISLQNDVISIFGLRIEVNKPKLIAISQISILFVFPFFALNYASAAIHSYHKIRASSLKSESVGFP
jgi:hypothetical protein